MVGGAGGGWEERGQHSLHPEAIHEHDMVAEGPVDVQVDLLDLRGVQRGLLLHSLVHGDRANSGRLAMGCVNQCKGGFCFKLMKSK